MALPLRKAHFSWHRHRFLRENTFSKLHIALSLRENALPKALIPFSARKVGLSSLWNLLSQGKCMVQEAKAFHEHCVFAGPFQIPMYRISTMCAFRVCLTACLSVFSVCLSVCLCLSVPVCLSVFLSVEGRRGGREGREERKEGGEGRKMEEIWIVFRN